MLRQVIHQCRIFYRFNPVADALCTQLTDRLPDAFWASGFTGMNGNAQACVTSTVEMAEEQAAREAQLITGQIQRGNAVAVGQQSV
ncbi:hypothetical protein D3C71_1878650 [compost metagenome]